MLLQLNQLALGYQGNPLLSNVNLSLEPGKIYCLLGGNGCGKSTLLRTIAGVLPSLAGDITLTDRPLSRWSIRERAKLIAWVPQQHLSPFAYSALEMVIMGGSTGLTLFAMPDKALRRRALETLTMLGIGKLAARSYPTLSGGERQLVLIARALVQRPALMLLDEPAASLDFGHQIALLEKVRELKNSGMALLMATHHPLHASAIADSVICITPEGEVRQGAPQALLSCDSLAKLYRVSPQAAARWLNLNPERSEKIAC